MADNVLLPATGSGTANVTAATDDVAGIHYPYVKLADGALGGTGLIGGDASNGLDVDVTRLPALVAGSANIGDVDVLTMPDVTVIGKAADGAAVSGNPVLIAGQDGTNVQSIKTDASGELQVDVLTLPALIAGTANIGDVDVLTVPAPLSTSGNGTAASALRVTVASDTTGVLQQIGSMVTLSTDVTRPADTAVYAANDALSDSTTAPTSGGFTFTGAGRISGGSGIITDAIIVSSADAVTLLQGEVYIFNQSATNINDNAAFAVSDAEAKTCIGRIQFTLEDIGNNGWFHAQNLSIGYTCVGTANLRFLVRVKNAYTPVSAEVFTFIIKCIQAT